MNKLNFSILLPLSLFALASCNSGSSGGSGPSNAFTQANSNGNFLTFSYSTSLPECQNVIAVGNSIYYNSGTYGYNYNINNSSAQLCDSNNNNCLNSNNTNTPCISGTQTLNGVAEQVVWNNCSYSQNTFTAQLTISNSTQSCTGTVSGQSTQLPDINAVTHNGIHVLIPNPNKTNNQ